MLHPHDAPELRTCKVCHETYSVTNPVLHQGPSIIADVEIVAPGLSDLCPFHVWIEWTHRILVSRIPK